MTPPCCHASPRAVDSRGTVFVEFLIVFVPIFILFLGIVQLALIFAAQRVVAHAAYAGARTAAVVLDDDPRHYEDTPRGVIEAEGTGGTQDDGYDNALLSVLSAGDDASLAVPSAEPSEEAAEAPNDSPRMRAIRHSVHLRLLPIAPTPRLLRDASAARRHSVATGLELDPLGRLSQALSGLSGLTALSFPIEPGARELHLGRVPLDPPAGSLGPPANVTLRVAYLFLCVVPAASHLLCEDAATLVRDAAGPGLPTAQLAPGTRAVLLTAEATLPAPTAPYAYQSEVEP